MLYILAIVEQQYLGNIALQSQQLDTRPFSHLVEGPAWGRGYCTLMKHVSMVIISFASHQNLTICTLKMEIKV